MENGALLPRILSAKFETIRPTESYVLLHVFYYRHSVIPSVTTNNSTTQQND